MALNGGEVDDADLVVGRGQRASGDVILNGLGEAGEDEVVGAGGEAGGAGLGLHGDGLPGGGGAVACEELDLVGGEAGELGGDELVRSCGGRRRRRG